ncbi:LADA_0E06524g1_1 [Lachancea dasiensis]|uniref:LADA_0E06524g1_1 n=1 Tax=Lachancea dasiensis TaxID=1072105 RepID=A0A1G4JCG5_9SACH|nr:LADA_0E06524g1_1 [Lachancea dasiensis]
MSVVNSNSSPLENGGFGLYRGFSTSSEKLGPITTPGTSSPGKQGSMTLAGSSSSNNNSPLHLATMLNNLTMNGTTSQGNAVSPTPGPFVLKLSNIPEDITIRECHALFAVAIGVSNIELIRTSNNTNNFDQSNAIIAKFDSLHLASQYASILDGKFLIFGPEYPYKLKVEVFDESTHQHISFQQQVQLSPKYSAQALQSQTNLQQSHAGESGHRQQSTQSQSSKAQAQPSQVTHDQQDSQPQNAFQLPSSSNVVSPPQSASSVKRPGLYAQRSRFSFSDPFAENNTQSQPASHDVATTPLKSQDAGKSFLLMENDEINESIWGSNGGMPSSIGGLAANSQPATPSLEWGAPQRRQSSSFFNPVPTNTVPSNDMPMNLSSTLPHPMGANLPQHSNLPFSIVGHGQATNTPSSSDVVLPQQSSGQQASQNTLPPAVPQSQEPQSSNASQKSVSQRPTTSKGSQSNLVIPQKTPSSPSLASTGGISQVDLSLLARVPPPANPADQNPPCNTLYVGNLPPDATEHELRQLFSTQKGFRRLSFRNKNTNGNGHGPMCFVEFEDVAHATRALAELYGRQLPRTNTNHNNKGGIRLSFSKNPLGVRGPSSRRSGNGGSVGNGNYSYTSAFSK